MDANNQHIHRWSGWPGAFCLKCGAGHLLELAIADGVYDPFADTWTSEEARREYDDGAYPVSDEEARQRYHERGIPVGW